MRSMTTSIIHFGNPDGLNIEIIHIYGKDMKTVTYKACFFVCLNLTSHTLNNFQSYTDMTLPLQVS